MMRRSLRVCGLFLLACVSAWASAAAAGCGACQVPAAPRGDFRVVNAEDLGWVVGTVEVAEDRVTFEYTLADGSAWQVTWAAESPYED